MDVKDAIKTQRRNKTAKVKSPNWRPDTFESSFFWLTLATADFNKICGIKSNTHKEQGFALSKHIKQGE